MTENWVLCSPIPIFEFTIKAQTLQQNKHTSPPRIGSRTLSQPISIREETEHLPPIANNEVAFSDKLHRNRCCFNQLDNMEHRRSKQLTCVWLANQNGWCVTTTTTPTTPSIMMNVQATHKDEHERFWSLMHICRFVRRLASEYSGSGIVHFGCVPTESVFIYMRDRLPWYTS